MRNFTRWLGTFVARRNELLLLRTIFKEWFCNVASCCFYKILTDSYLLYKDNVPFLVEATTISIYGRFLLFRGLGASFNTILFFSHLFRVISPDNLSPYQRTLFLLRDFLRRAVCDVNPVKSFSRQSLTIEWELVPLELFSQTSTFIFIASF